MYKTKLQMDEEARLDEEKNLSEREKRSRKLRPELEKLLTEEQKQKSLNEEVALKLKDLPASLLSRVEDYIKYLVARPGQSIGIDMGRLSEFEIVFLPPSHAPGGSLGVNGRTDDGTPIGF